MAVPRPAIPLNETESERVGLSAYMAGIIRLVSSRPKFYLSPDELDEWPCIPVEQL